MSDDIKENRTTTSGKPPEPGLENSGAPGPINPLTGQHTSYWILTEEERAKGFVRPVRDRYQHVGLPAPRYPLRDLTAEELERYPTQGYIKYEDYPESESPLVGRFWTQAQLDKVDKGCGWVTTMGSAIAETYARNPRFYGSTFCSGCREHFPVGPFGEFTWLDGERVGT